MKLPEHTLTLYKLNEEPICELHNIENLVYKAFFVGIDEIHFTVTQKYFDYNGRLVVNEIYDKIEGDFLIKLNNDQFFIITNIEEDIDENLWPVKTITAFSREYELKHKKIVDYNAVSRLVYDPTNSVSDNIETGVLNYIFNNLTKAWSIGYYDPDLLNRYRAIDFSSSNLIEAFEVLQRQFNCIFKFNTVDQTISVYDFDTQLGQDRGLCISDANFIKSLSKNINSDELKTRLYLYGADNISVQDVNITRQPYIDNFQFYRNTKYMSQELLDALNDYDDAMALHQTALNDKLDDRSNLLGVLENANNSLTSVQDLDDVLVSSKGLIALRSDLAENQTYIDSLITAKAIKQRAIATTSDAGFLPQLHSELNGINADLTNYETIKTGILNEIQNIESFITLLENNLTILDNEILDIQANLNPNIYFSANSFKELDRFIRVDTYVDTAYTKYNTQELYNEGLRILNKISAPSIQFDLDVIDFLQLVEGQHFWDKFILGDNVTLEHSALNFKYSVKLIAYEHNIDDHSLSLTFSNANSIDDATIYLRDLLEQISSTSTTVDFNKYKWAQIDTLSSRISTEIDNKLEQSRQSILNAVGQEYLFDDSGLWLYKTLPNGAIDDAQIRAINNTIALTNDNWNTVNTAITPEGVIAEVVKGKLGQFATIDTHQILVTPSTELVPGTLSNFNGVSINSDHGIVITRADGAATVTLNATGGLTVKNNISNENVLTIDPQGNINLKGNITLDGGYINWDNVNGFDIPEEYTDADALSAWANSGYATYIDANGLYTGNIIASKILVGGSNGSFSYTDLLNKPTILSSSDVTTITNNTISTTNVVATNLKVQSANIQGTLSVDRLVSSDGVQSVTVGSGGLITFSSALLGLPVGGTSMIGMFPLAGTTKTQKLQAPMDNTNLTVYDNQTLSLGKINLVNAMYGQFGSAYDGGIISWGYLTVVGAKNAVERTNNYGDVLLHSYETPSPYYGDIGNGVIENGECTIYIDNILSECINLDLEYHIFIQKYTVGNIERIEKFKEYFIVYGTEGLEFSWELKGKRKNFENERFSVFTELRKDGVPNDTFIPAFEQTPSSPDENIDNYERVD